jgi:regulator of replication initiation timing
LEETIQLLSTQLNRLKDDKEVLTCENNALKNKNKELESDLSVLKQELREAPVSIKKTKESDQLVHLHMKKSLFFCWHLKSRISNFT